MTLTVTKTAAEPPAQSATSSSVAYVDGRTSCFPSTATARGPQMVAAVEFVLDYSSVAGLGDQWFNCDRGCVTRRRRAAPLVKKEAQPAVSPIMDSP